jgi:hypothetical protein
MKRSGLLLASVCMLWLVVPSVAPLAEASPPNIRSTPHRLSFGAVDVGSHSDPRELTWTNMTDRDIGIFTFVLCCGENFDYAFPFGGTCEELDRIPAGESCSLTVVFHPSTTGRLLGDITLSYFFEDDPSTQQPLVIVPLQGIGK